MVGSEKALGAVKVIKDQIQYRSESLLSLARGYLSLLLKLERCQIWFLKNIFHVPSFAHSILILKLTSLNSIESEIDMKRLLFLGHRITEPKIAPVVKICLEAELKVILTPI